MGTTSEEEFSEEWTEKNVNKANSEFLDIIAESIFNYGPYDDLSTQKAGAVRRFFDEFKFIAKDLNNVIKNIDQGIIPQQQKRILDALVENEEVKEAFIQSYAELVLAEAGNTSGRPGELEAQTEGYKIYLVIDKYKKYLEAQGELTDKVEVEDLLTSQVNKMGNFKVFLDHIDSYKRVQDKLNIRPGRRRHNTAPKETEPWQCRIGASTFFVPPTNIQVNQTFQTGSLAGAAIRQPNSPKINMGHSETVITMTIYFPTHETIWGFDGDYAEWKFQDWNPETNSSDPQNITSDAVIDKYLSSLRGLVTQFKYTPFVPVQNKYLNQAHDITAVCLKNMTVSTVQGFPFVAAVTLQMTKFNFQPFMPMIDHFDQAIHWGKLRQMLSRGAIALDKKVNKGFLLEKTVPIPGTYSGTGPREPDNTKYEKVYDYEYRPALNKAKEIADGKFFELYYPLTTPGKIFTPDTTDFRQPGEDQVFTEGYWDFFLTDLGFDLTGRPQFNFFEYDTQKAYNTNERDVVRAWLTNNNLVYDLMTSDKFDEFINEEIVKGTRDGWIDQYNEESVKIKYKNEWFNVLFEKILTEDPIFQKIKEAKDARKTDYIIREWEVPMGRVDIDWSRCIVEGVAVSLSNTFAKLQIQLQDEPTYQHIGGGDSGIDVSMIVLGEENLIKIRRAIQHINGLARMERRHGVLGFLGFRNVFTAICGIKYALPTEFTVDTIPNYPNCYRVRMSFIDFDVMQQQREKLETKQQEELIEQFGKRNPFLRIKQSWGATQCYPDMPLDVRDEDGELLGHLDPDWYFRSFEPNNDDLINWGLDKKVVTLVQNFSQMQETLKKDDNSIDSEDRRKINSSLINVEAELRSLVQDGVPLPVGWHISDSGQLTGLSDNETYDPRDREYRYYLGSYGEDQEKVAVLDMFPGGYFALGEKSKGSGEVEYVTGMSYLSEDLASENTKNVPSLEGTSRLSDYQHEYLDGKNNPNAQYEAIMQDWHYRNQSGRMLKAFPTYMLWLIDEGGQFAGMKLFDNLYGLNSIIDFSVSSSTDDPISDTLVLRLSNIYQKLTRPYSESIFDEDDPLKQIPIGQAIETMENRYRNINSGLFDTIVEIENIRLKPGVRVHLRAGYGSNVNQLQTLFNGTITEVQAGEIMTVTAQSDAVEFSSFVNSQSQDGHSGKLDGSVGNFWLSEPRDLMVRLLSMGTSNFREWLTWGSKGVLFSESKFGIRHFGSILYEPMTQSEVDGTFNKQTNIRTTLDQASQTGKSGSTPFAGLLGEELANSIEDINSASDLVIPSTYGPLFHLAQEVFLNSSARRDYEVFKRNIYPGNGTGIAQFMGGDLLDAGIIISQAGTYYENEEDTLDPTLTDPKDTSSTDDGNWLEDITNRYDDTVKKPTIDKFWEDYFKTYGLNADELETLLESGNYNSGDIEFDSGESFLSQILGSSYDVLTAPNRLVDSAFSAIGGPLNGLASTAFQLTNPLTFAGSFLKVGSGIVNGLGRFGASGMGQALGLSGIIKDDDLAGFDEVSFRAQTYMKTIWDLFEVCAALLPNYIVAVRPFEDRSTVFYGKPHWLYTSGVIPVTTGVQTSQQSKPRLSEPDSEIVSALSQINNTSVDTERMITAAKQSSEFRDISKLLANNIDPYDVGSTDMVTQLVTEEQVSAIVEEYGKDIDTDLVDPLAAFKTVDYSELTEGEIGALIRSIKEAKKDDHTKKIRVLASGDRWNGIEVDYETDEGDEVFEVYQDFTEKYKKDEENAQSEYEDFLQEYIEYKQAQKRAVGSSGSDRVRNYDLLVEQIYKDRFDDESLINLLNRDPITFAYQFGWKFSRVDAWIGPEANVGYDVIGDVARRSWDSDYSPTIGTLGNNEGRSKDEGLDIWLDFRNGFRYSFNPQEDFVKYFPTAEKTDYEAIMDLFYRFLWQDPYNRAWVVIRAEKYKEDLVGLTNPWSGQSWEGMDFVTGKPVTIETGEDRWVFADGQVDPAFKIFLASGDIFFDSNGVPRSPATKAWMKANEQQGDDATNYYVGWAEDTKDWFDQNVGQVLGLVTDTLSSLIASIRLSLAQLAQGLQLGGTQQRQSNMLNAALNDSIYYQLGKDTNEPLLALCDNPFTREYGEPVVEIREPFQRVHMISSFQDILSNQIRENLNGVATMVTCVSDGKNPVSVHFDKGIPPDRQIEKVVESGLYWDNAFGAGFFGFLQPLIHPFETLRGINKGITGSSDQLSARRVGLYHLKNSLKQIYGGEIIIAGNPDIRAWDLLYIADSQERMFGMCEVGQVIHHFTPETGFITSITPNALVSINDPGRWTMLSYLGNKFMNVNMRDEMRALMGIRSENFVKRGLDYIDSEDLVEQFSNHMEGGVQWTQGNSALVRDLGAIFTGGGIKGLTKRDEILAKTFSVDIGLKVAQGLTTAAGGLIGALGGPTGIAVGAGLGYGVTQLGWEAWDWVKDNILDQSGAYVSWLTKDGQPMDAGLSYFQNSAVGANHTLSLFPNVFGIPSPRVNYREENGHYRITTNDLLMKLGWTELETTAIYRDVSMFVNQVNEKVLGITGRGTTVGLSNDDFMYAVARVLEPTGEDIGDSVRKVGIEDGDTLNVRITIPGTTNFGMGEIIAVRVGAVNTSELEYHDNAYTEYNETAFNPNNDLGRAAYEYLANRYTAMSPSERLIAIRIKKSEPKSYDRYVATIFHNVPSGTAPSARAEVLLGYAAQNPPLPLQSYLSDGRPYTLNWELVMAGYGNVDMRDSLWDNNWNEKALERF